MLFQPLKVFVPIACSSGLLGVIKVVFDIVTAVIRRDGFSWSTFSGPVISTSALLLLLGSYQLLLIGMMADGVIRRIARHNQPGALSHSVVVSEMTIEGPVKEQATTAQAGR
jgi:hypothetical protein